MSLSASPRSIIIVFLTFLAVTPLSALGNNDDLIAACSQKQTGQLRIVSDRRDCGPAENPIIWNRTGVQGPPGPEGPPGPPGESGVTLVVFDADATELGPLIGSPQSGPIFRTWNDKQKIMMYLSSEDGELFSPCGQYIYFEQPNCLGAGWIPSLCNRMLLGPLLDSENFVAATEPPTVGLVSFQSRILRPYTECQEVSGQAGGGQFDPAGWAPLREFTSEDIGYSLPRKAPLYLVPAE